MKKIDTSNITGTSWLPVLGNFAGNSFVGGSPDNTLAGLDFLQQAYFECLYAVSKFIVNDQTVPTIMYIAPPPAHTLSETLEGFMNYEGEIYYFATSIVALSIFDTETRYQNAGIVTDYSTGDPITFSDLATHNIHQVRQVQLTWSTVRNAGNLPDYDLWQNATTNSYANVLAQTYLNTWVSANFDPLVANYNSLLAGLIPAPTLVPGSGTYGFHAGWNNSAGIRHTYTSANPLSYYKVLNRVYLWGEISNGTTLTGESTIFTLPADYRPIAYEEVFELTEISGVTSTGDYAEPARYHLVITNDSDSPGAVKLLSTSPESVTISLSGISFAQGTYAGNYYTTLESEVIPFSFFTEHDDA